MTARAASLDLRALLRAAYVDATTGEVVEGGSTITQQLVKKLYVGDEQTIGRKIREAYLAWKLEKRLSKDRILTRYLNTVYFGNGAYGIKAASEAYFGKQPLEVSRLEARPRIVVFLCERTLQLSPHAADASSVGTV